MLSVNFNLERLARAGDPPPQEPARAPASAETGRATVVLARVYDLAYGWQDRLVERVDESHGDSSDFPVRIAARTTT